MRNVVLKYKPKKGAGSKAVARHSWSRKGEKLSAGGVVGYWVLAPSANASTQVGAPAGLIESLKAGLPFRELEVLRTKMDVPMEKLAAVLGISKATLHRRKDSGRLDTAESDRVVRFARLLGRAAAVMESLEAGRRWLASPQVGLGGAVPLEYADTEVGAREVEELLGRIEYSVYS